LSRSDFSSSTSQLLCVLSGCSCHTFSTSINFSLFQETQLLRGCCAHVKFSFDFFTPSVTQLCNAQPFFESRLSSSVDSYRYLYIPVVVITEYETGVPTYTLRLSVSYSRVRDPMRSLNIFNLPNPSGRTRPWGLFSL
jgi:hypothetical protein